MGKKIIYTSFVMVIMIRNIVATKFFIRSWLKLTGIEINNSLKIIPPDSPQATTLPAPPHSPPYSCQYSATNSILVNNMACFRLHQFRGCSRFPDLGGQ